MKEGIMGQGIMVQEITTEQREKIVAKEVKRKHPPQKFYNTSPRCADIKVGQVIEGERHVFQKNAFTLEDGFWVVLEVEATQYHQRPSDEGQQQYGPAFILPEGGLVTKIWQRN